VPQSELRLVKRSAEYIEKARVRELPRQLRGIYVLYRRQGSRTSEKYRVVYVGMAAAGRRGGIRGRLARHTKSKRKTALWTHFSAFEVWDNIRDDEVAELEGLLRHIYRYDPEANKLNIQKGFKRARRVRQNNLKLWHQQRAKK
jgi:hypothetical protein